MHCSLWTVTFRSWEIRMPELFALTSFPDFHPSSLISLIVLPTLFIFPTTSQ